MNRLTFSLILFVASIHSRCQTPSATRILSSSEVAALFPDAVRRAYHIDFPIRRVYHYVDRSGKYYCILTESLDSVIEDEKRNLDTLHFFIRAINLIQDSRKFKKVWEINDYAIRDPKIEGIEQSIWFWTRYVEFTDFDGDGLIDPIIVYGSRSDSDLASGRIKFIIYYKGQKIAIRHQDSDLDEGRGTQVDKAFHSLPPDLKNAITRKMLTINKADQGIFEKTKF